MSVCQPCQTATLIASGQVATSLRSVDAHAECARPGRCDCGCDYSRGLRCSQCGRARRPEEISSEGECIDRANCAAAIVAAFNHGHTPPQAAGPTRLQRDLDTVGKRRREIGADAFRTPSRPKPTRRCECCGEPTKGGRFRMGHDARLASMLTRQARDGDDDALSELATRWPQKVPDDLRERAAAIDLRPESWVLERATARWAAEPA